MTSIQERLQLKRVPMDTWSVREQLCLASAVVRSGDQNWMSVSRALKTVGEPNRPPDWYSQKSCAAQYGALLEHVETPKRKKRSSEDPVETPQESIVKRLTQDRITEIQKTIADMNQQYEQLKNEISEVRNQTTSEDRLREIWSSIEAAKRTQERENARRAALLKEREERRARAAHNARTSVSNEPPSPSGPATPSSPLLTSLLKSSPVVTTPQHMSHPASVVDTMSPSVTAPTLSMLLEKSSPQQDSKRAAIEHIKSQLVQIEQQLKANTPPSPAPLVAPPAPSLDIDDIEINAEDVYVFRDVDIHIPNVPSHDKPVDKPITPKKEPESIEIEVEPAPAVEETNMNIAKEESTIIEDIKEEVPIDVENVPMEETTVQRITEETVDTEMDDIKIAFPEVKFPTTEIKVIQAEEQQIKEEVNDPGTSQEEVAEETVVIEDEVVEHDEEIDSVEKQISNLHAETVVPPQLQIPLPPQSPQPPQLPEPQPQLPPQVLQSLLPPQVSQSQLPQVSQSLLPPQVSQTQLPPQVSQTQLPPQVLESQLPPQLSQSLLPPQVSPQMHLPPQVSQSQLPPQVSQSPMQPQVSQIQLPQDSPQIQLPPQVSQIQLPPQDLPQIQLPPQVLTQSQLPQSPPILSPLGSEESIVTDVIETGNIPLPPEPQIIDPPLPPEPEVMAKEEPEVNELQPEVKEEKIEEKELPAKSEEDSKGEEDAEDSIPLKQMIREETLRTIREERITDDTHTETDDDTPMELSREEEKDGKKKRDYSRKKKPDSRPCSGSESAAEASAPDSPGGDAERDHRLWKKSVMLVYSRLCAHKYASVFLRPISDEEAPGYSAVVRRPMDLSTIRRNIESGRMRTTAQFQRDLLLMLSNALMYNSSEHSVYTMAKEMHEEAVSELGILVCAQAHAALGAPPARRKRRRPDEHNVYKRQH